LLPWRPQADPFKPSLNLEDVGTRELHLIQLLDVWNGGLNILLAKSEVNRTERETEMIKTLMFAIELLKKHMTSIGSDYHENFYKADIEGLPDPWKTKQGKLGF